LQTALCIQNYGAGGHSTCQASSFKNVQTPYDLCENFTLLTISEVDYRIISTHIYTHTYYVNKIIYIFGGFWVKF